MREDTEAAGSGATTETQTVSATGGDSCARELPTAAGSGGHCLTAAKLEPDTANLADNLEDESSSRENGNTTATGWDQRQLEEVAEAALLC